MYFAAMHILRFLCDFSSSSTQPLCILPKHSGWKGVLNLALTNQLKHSKTELYFANFGHIGTLDSRTDVAPGINVAAPS